MSDLSLIMTAAGSIVLLLFLVMKARLHAVVALILVSMVAGLAAGMNPADIANTIQKGMGGTLGFVAVVVALGAMFGKVMEVTGALDRVAHTLLGKFGVKRANWAMALTGFVCALPLFFDVAVVLLIGRRLRHRPSWRRQRGEDRYRSAGRYRDLPGLPYPGAGPDPGGIPAGCRLRLHDPVRPDRRRTGADPGWPAVR